MPPKKKPASPKLPTPVDSVSHKDKRANIPTEELRDFIADEEKAPKTVLYPRDPSLDPQLVWKGKDEQDRQDLAVPAVPIYIQEHIKPQNIVELVRGTNLSLSHQPSLFNDFNGLSFEDRVDFYHHEQHWSNRMILGDSLMVMTSLAEKEGLKGKVQMIYFDPPYGIKFGSNWQVSTRKRDVKDGKAEDTTRQPEQVKAFRDTWQLGIHSYLSYMRDRLMSAHELLSESGSLFVQIGDENEHLVRSLLDEVFGSENFAALITFSKTSGASSPMASTLVLAGTTDHILWYAKNIEQVKYRQLFTSKDENATADQVFSWVDLPDGTRRALTADERNGSVNLPDGAKLFARADLTSQTPAESISFNIKFQNKTFDPGNRGWRTHKEGIEKLINANRVTISGSSLRFIQYFNDYPVSPTANLWTDTATGSFTEDKIYVVQTATKVVQRCLMMTTDPGDLVLDPTCGSGTTAYVAEQWGRRWITIDTSRVSIALARTRLMSGRFPYYLLADSVEGRRKEAEMSGKFAADDGRQTTDDGQSSTVNGLDIKRGFVYERVPHVTLKSIANNEEIDEIHAKVQGQLDELRAQINKAAKQKWEEWEVPRDLSGFTSDKAQRDARADKDTSPSDSRGNLTGLLQKYWDLRRARQKEIDASIARRADTEFLYDKPYQDNKRVRVSGPFTVESLSPHRVLAPDDPATAFKEDVLNTHDFTQMILENLKSAGVQNTVKNQRLKFDSLEPYAGTWIHAVGEYTEKDGKPRRAALSIGPELGTVSAEQVKEAAKEAVLGVGFDLLIICGFAFDPHVSEEAKRYGKLTVLPTRMNPDLAMGDELLKKTGAGNLFMVFGEPDVEIRKADLSRLYVVLKGLDVYDPTTGEIRSNSTDDIACWFLDSDYNGESFIVRHAYFTGADEPYDKLKRALRAEIDESAWSVLYTNTSVPFEKPSTGKIAVKVINHYGDEVLKVFEV
jgi:adenine-specific DNA-methyltransferase